MQNADPWEGLCFVILFWLMRKSLFTHTSHVSSTNHKAPGTACGAISWVRTPPVRFYVCWMLEGMDSIWITTKNYTEKFGNLLSNPTKGGSLYGHFWDLKKELFSLCILLYKIKIYIWVYLKVLLGTQSTGQFVSPELILCATKGNFLSLQD